MNRIVFAFVLLCSSATRVVEAQGGVPQIKCEIGTTTWCIATFDGSISMQDAGEARIWTLQARTDRSKLPMKIVEAKACSDTADEAIHLVKVDKKDAMSSAAPQVAEYVLNANGCKLRFEIPKGESAATYKQVMLYGILVGSDKMTQLYKAR
ncbi:MAG TPA: hypothetical protein VIT90_01170 [Lysobacter sp.]